MCSLKPHYAYVLRLLHPHTSTRNRAEHSQESNEVAVSRNTRSSQSAANAVFATPELLEKILKDCNACDILRSKAVSQTWRKTFDHSDTLQKYAQLVSAAKDLKWQWSEKIWDNALGLVVRSRWEDVPKCIARFELLFDFDFGAFTAIKITRQQRECFATQPPCVKMAVQVICCEDADESIYQPDGIRLGHLVDTARRMDAEHQNCPRMIESFATKHQICRYPRFIGYARYSKNHATSQNILELLKPHQKILKERQDAGWTSAWNAFKEAREAAETSHTTPPKWPAFLAENKHLAPSEYQLSSSEAAAADIERLPRLNVRAELRRLSEIENSDDDEVENANDGGIENTSGEEFEESNDGDNNISDNEGSHQRDLPGDIQGPDSNKAGKWWKSVGFRGREILGRCMCGMVAQ